MKRTAFVLAALLALGLPAAAQSRRVVAERVHQSREDVLRYWSLERMGSAKPVERAKPGGAAGGGSSTNPYPFTSSEVPSPYTAFPTSTNGKVYFTDDRVNYVCSGTALVSANESLVWTAGHCVNRGPGGFFTNWMFVPAYRDGLRPFGTFTATSLMTTSQWQGSGNFAYDVGAAKVGPVSGVSLTDTVGGRGIQFNYTRQRQYQSYGYPAAKKFSGQRLRVCDAPWGLDDNSVSPATMGIGCDHTGGSSGGGWISGNNLYSVNSYGYSSLRNVMFGPYQGSVAQALFTTAAS